MVVFDQESHLADASTKNEEPMNINPPNHGLSALGAILLWICSTVVAATHSDAAAVHSAGFSIEQVLSAPFPSDLVASSDGNHFAWVSNESGRRNVWLATHRTSGGGYDSRAITAFTEDDGQVMADLAFVPRHDGVLFVRGGDFEDPDKVAPNPAHLTAGVEQAIYWVNFQGGTPVRLAEGHAPLASPDGERVLFLHKGEIWTVGLKADAKPSQLFKARGSLDSLRFSPDGNLLAFVSNRGDHSFVGVYSFKLQTVHWIDPGAAQDLEPRWSPDGSRLAFLRLPWSHDEVGISPHRTGQPWSIRVAVIATDSPAREVYRAPRGAGSVFHPLSSDTQLFWTQGDRLVFPAENDGWLHLYAVSTGGGEPQLLTPGNFEIEYAAAAPNGSAIIYAGNSGDIDRRHLWRLRFPNGAPVALTAGTGIETMPAVASDGESIGFLRSDAKLPMRSAVLEAGKTGVDLVRNGLPKDFPSSLVTPESVVLPLRAGVAAHAQVFLPPGGSAGTRHPAVVFMHGGPIRQMLAGWHYMDYYSNAYGLNQYLASKGYVVLALNYRSGIGYGLDYREAERTGSSGASEYNDLLSAAAYLRARADVDPARIGLWGGSYGGYMTALGLSRNSDLFAAGVDLHGVHDWHNWSLGERGGRDFYALDATPADLETALAASPISAISTWRSPVLLIHGDDDRNVAFSETMRLVEALNRQGVDHQELILPDEIHGFLRHESWLRAYHATSEFLDTKLSAH
jgi:dipeptidyl aminopeptidase/acylaminoacyl peptidase